MDKSFSFVKNYWSVILFACSILVSLGAYITTIKNLDSRVTSLEAKQELLIEDISIIKQSVIKIETSLDFIKTSI